MFTLIVTHTTNTTLFYNFYNTIKNTLGYKTNLEKKIINLKDYTSTVTFDDVIGAEVIKDIFNYTSDFLIHPKPFLDIMIIPPTRYLLAGPSHSGKNFFVNTFIGSLAQKLQENYIDKDIYYLAVSGYEAKKYGIKNIFKTIKNYAPAILYIDECDLIDLQREADPDLLNNFLTGMDSSISNDPLKPIIIIMTTNRPETLDAALFARPSGFEEIRFEYPPFQFRKEFLIRECNNMNVNISLESINFIAEQTEYRAFSDLTIILERIKIYIEKTSTCHPQVFITELFDEEHKPIKLSGLSAIPVEM